MGAPPLPTARGRRGTVDEDLPCHHVLSRPQVTPEVGPSWQHRNLDRCVVAEGSRSHSPCTHAPQHPARLTYSVTTCRTTNKGAQSWALPF